MEYTTAQKQAIQTELKKLLAVVGNVKRDYKTMTARHAAQGNNRKATIFLEKELTLNGVEGTINNQLEETAP
jgi:hypothetical protein